MRGLIETVRVKVFIQSKRGQIRNKQFEIVCRGRESLEAVRVFVEAVRVFAETMR